MTSSRIGCDTAERGFQPAKETLDFVAFPVDFSIKFGGQFAVGLGRDHVDSALFPDQISDPVCVICFVREHMLARLQIVQ